MRNAAAYRLSLIGTLLVFSMNSWGSEPLPQLIEYSRSRLTQRHLLDTLPGKATLPVHEHAAQQAAETVVPNLVKEVPKSRKRIKPAAVGSSVKLPPKKILKPKIVIKKVNVNLP